MASMGTLSGNYKQFCELKNWILENGDPLLFDALYSEFSAYRTNQKYGWCDIANFSKEQNKFLWENCPLEWLRISINNIYIFDIDMFEENL